MLNVIRTATNAKKTNLENLWQVIQCNNLVSTKLTRDKKLDLSFTNASLFMVLY